MVLLVVGLVAFVGLAAVVLRLADRVEASSTPLLVVVWLTYVLHADTVILAAFSDVGRLDVPAGPTLLIAGLLGAVGLVVFVLAALALAREAQLVRGEASALVRSGPYGWSRHPQDLGWGLLLLAVAVAGANVVGLGLVVVFFVFVRRLWRIEEGRLAERFGAAYAGYRAAVPVLPLGRRRAESGAVLPGRRGNR